MIQKWDIDLNFITLKNLTFVVCLLALAANAFSQTNRTMRWAFPRYNGLDFSSGSPVPTNDSLVGFGGTSAISDEDGNLLFYSNGETVWQANGAVMLGGSGLAGDQNATQSSIIVPSVSNPDRYYLFTVDALSPSPNVVVTYYFVEMSFNNGNGQVIGGTQLIDTASEKIAATRHGNDRDYWVVGHRFNSDEFNAFLVDQSGVNQTPVTSAVGVVHANTTYSADQEGQMKISPDGKWIATCNFSSGNVQLFRFNNETGVVSDPITLASGVTTFPYGCEFSADSKKFYYSRSASNASNPYGIHQFDLDHASIECLLASETVVTNGDPFKVYADLQLGLDKKIYASYYRPTFFADSLGAIHEPEKICPDCDYEDKALQINHGMRYGLTNFVSSFLSDGITYEFGTNCEYDTTWFTPEDTFGLDSVRWVFGDPTSGNNVSTDLTAGHLFSGPDTFLVTLYSHRGNQTDTFTRNVIIWDIEPDLLGNNTTICNGQPISLEAEWYDACMLWSDNSTGTTYTTGQEGYHWVEVSYQSCVWRDSIYIELVSQPPQFTLGNDTSVCGSINFVIDPDLPNVAYSWQDGSHDTTYTVTSTGVYWLEATNACGSSSDTLNVEINTDAQPVLDFPEDTTVCSTSGFSLDVTFIGATYDWSDGFNGSVRTITEEGTYWVVVENSCDSVADTFNVLIDEPLTSALIDRTVYCGVDDTLELLATSDSTSVDWSNASTGAFLDVSSGGVYYYEVENTCGSLNDSVRIDEWDTNYALEIGMDTILCVGSAPILIGDTTDDYPWSYAWNNGATVATQESNEGIYVLTATHRCATLTEQVIIEQAPSIQIADSLIERTICQGESVEVGLNRSSTQTIEWSTGEKTPTIMVNQAGTYSVVVTDSFGCAYTDSTTFNDNCPGLVFSPNIFTPNGDGINDEFCIDLENILHFNLIIYNRWGIEVYYSADQTKCWDGSIQGTIASPGTYFYEVVTTDAQAEDNRFRGSVTLLP